MCAPGPSRSPSVTPVRRGIAYSRAGSGPYCFNKNFLVSEHNFRPLPAVEIEFDAIYNARFDPLKRHYLAAEIEILAYLSYDDPANTDQSRQEQRGVLSRPDGTSPQPRPAQSDGRRSSRAARCRRCQRGTESRSGRAVSLSDGRCKLRLDGVLARRAPRRQHSKHRWSGDISIPISALSAIPTLPRCEGPSRASDHDTFHVNTYESELSRGSSRSAVDFSPCSTIYESCSGASASLKWTVGLFRTRVNSFSGRNTGSIWRNSKECAVRPPLMVEDWMYTSRSFSMGPAISRCTSRNYARLSKLCDRSQLARCWCSAAVTIQFLGTGQPGRNNGLPGGRFGLGGRGSLPTEGVARLLGGVRHDAEPVGVAPPQP